MPLLTLSPVRRATFNDHFRHATGSGGAAAVASKDTKTPFFSELVGRNTGHFSQLEASAAAAAGAGLSRLAIEPHHHFSTLADLEQAMGRPIDDQTWVKVEWNRLKLMPFQETTTGVYDYSGPRPTQMWAPASNWATFSAKYRITAQMRAQEAAGNTLPMISFIRDLQTANANGDAVVWPNGEKHSYFLRAISAGGSELPAKYSHLANKPSIEAFELAQGQGAGRV